MSIYVLAPMAITYWGSAAVGGAALSALGITGLSNIAVNAIGAGIIQGGITALRGGDAGDVLKSAVLSGATSYIGGSIGKSVASNIRAEAIMNGDMSFTTADAIGRAVGSAATGALSGGLRAVLTNSKDPVKDILKGGLTAGLSSAVGSAVESITSDIPIIGRESESYNPVISRAAHAAIGASILGGSGKEAFASSLLESATQYAESRAKAAFKDYSDKVKLASSEADKYGGIAEQKKQLANSAIEDLHKTIDYLNQWGEKTIESINARQKKAQEVVAGWGDKVTYAQIGDAIKTVWDRDWDVYMYGPDQSIDKLYSALDPTGEHFGKMSEEYYWYLDEITINPDTGLPKGADWYYDRVIRLSNEYDEAYDDYEVAAQKLGEETNKFLAQEEENAKAFEDILLDAATAQEIFGQESGGKELSAEDLTKILDKGRKRGYSVEYEADRFYTSKDELTELYKSMFGTDPTDADLEKYGNGHTSEIYEELYKDKKLADASAAEAKRLEAQYAKEQKIKQQREDLRAFFADESGQPVPEEALDAILESASQYNQYADPYELAKKQIDALFVTKDEAKTKLESILKREPTEEELASAVGDQSKLEEALGVAKQTRATEYAEQQAAAREEAARVAAEQKAARQEALGKRKFLAEQLQTPLENISDSDVKSYERDAARAGKEFYEFVDEKFYSRQEIIDGLSEVLGRKPTAYEIQMASGPKLAYEIALEKARKSPEGRATAAAKAKAEQDALAKEFEQAITEPEVVVPGLDDLQKLLEDAKSQPGTQTAKSNYAGEFAGMYFDPSYVATDGSIGTYRPIEGKTDTIGSVSPPTTEGGEPDTTPDNIDAGGGWNPALVTPQSPETTPKQETTVPTQEEQQSSIDSLLKELEKYEQPKQEQPVVPPQGVVPPTIDEILKEPTTPPPETPVPPAQKEEQPATNGPATTPETPTVPTQEEQQSSIDDLLKELEQPTATTPEEPPAPVREEERPVIEEPPAEPEPTTPEPEAPTVPTQEEQQPSIDDLLKELEKYEQPKPELPTTPVQEEQRPVVEEPAKEPEIPAVEPEAPTVPTQEEQQPSIDDLLKELEKYEQPEQEQPTVPAQEEQATVPTQEEQQASIDDLLKELEPYAPKEDVPETAVTEPQPEAEPETEQEAPGGWQGPMGPMTEDMTRRFNEEFARYLDSLGAGEQPPPEYGVQDLGITQENWDSFNQNLLQMQEEGRLPTQWRPNEDGTFTYRDDDGSSLTIDQNGNVVGYTQAPPGNLPGETPPGQTGGGQAPSQPARPPSRPPSRPPTVPRRPPGADQAMQQIQQYLQNPALLAQASQTKFDPIYAAESQMFDFGAPLDVNFFRGSKEKQGSQTGQQTTKIATGGYLDDLLDLLR